MALWIKDFVRKYPETVVHGYVSFHEIVEKLEQKYDVEELSGLEIPSLRMHRFNAVHLPRNESLGLSESQLQIQAIKIPLTEHSRHYTEKDYVPQITNPECCQDFIYLAYEEQVGYHYSNSSKLFLEVAVARGIPDDDRQKNTERYLDYLVNMQRYLEHAMPEISTLFSASEEESKPPAKPGA